MREVTCDGRRLEPAEGESLLDTLLRAGISVAHSCRAGLCQSCLVKALKGTPPPESQAGLRRGLVQQNFLLACLTRRGDLEVSTSAAAALEVPGRVARVEPLSGDVVRVLVESAADLGHRAGQYVTLVREDGLARSYSIASQPAEPLLELHVRVLPGGRMSGWLATAAAGAPVRLRGPAGECFYATPSLDAPLVLAGTGTGLAPLQGVLHDALAAGHHGPIVLFHGARTPEGLYLVAELQAAAAAHPNVEYVPCVLSGSDGAFTEGALDTVVMSHVRSFAGRHVWLCGDPELVQRLKRTVFLAGADLHHIHADPFVVAPEIQAGSQRAVVP